MKYPLILISISFLTYLSCVDIEITRIQPRSGPITGGTLISVWGAGFTGGEDSTECYWRGVGDDFGKSSDVTANINSTYIECELPAVFDIDNFIQISENRINLDIEFYISRNNTLSNRFSFTFFNLSKLAVINLTPREGDYSQFHFVTFSLYNLNYTQELACLLEGVTYPATGFALSVTDTVSCNLPPVPSSRRERVQLSLNGDHTGNIPPSVGTNLDFIFYNSAPMVRITYAPSLTRLYLDFDRQVEIGRRDQPNSGISPDCTQLFTTDTLSKLGSDARCTWGNYQQGSLVVELTKRSSLSGVSSLTLSSLQPIRSRYVLYSYLLPPNSLIAADYMDTHPIPVLYTYTHIPSCGDIAFSAISSQLGGTQLLSVVWSVTAPNNQASSLSPIFSSQLDLHWSISTSLFVPGVFYTVSLTLTNFLQNSATQSVSLIRAQPDLPPATVYHSLAGLRYAHSDHTIISAIELSPCLLLTPSPLTFSWSISNPITPLSNTNTPILHIPPHSLLPSTPYSILYSVSNGSLSRQYQFNFTATSSPPIALILGGNMRTHYMGEDLIIDGSASYDPSLQPLSYVWTCTDVISNTICRDKNNGILMSRGDLSIYTFPHNLLQLSLFLFTLIVSTRDARTSTTAQLTVDIGSSPDLIYLHPFTRPIPTRLNGSIAIRGLVRAQLQQAQLSISTVRDVAVSGVYYDYAQTLSYTPLHFTAQSAYQLPPDSSLFSTSQVQEFTLPVSSSPLLPGQTYRLSATLTANGVTTATAQVDIQMATLPHFGGLIVTSYIRDGVRIYSLLASDWRDVPSALPLKYRFGIGTSEHWLTPSTTLSQVDTPLLCSLTADLPLVVEVENAYGSRVYHSSQVSVTAHDDVMGAVEKVQLNLVYGYNVMSGLSIVSSILYYYRVEMMRIPAHISETLWSYLNSAYWYILPRDRDFSTHTIFLITEFITQTQLITDQQVEQMLDVLDHALGSVNTCPPVDKPFERGISVQLLNATLSAVAKLNTSRASIWYKLPAILTRLAYATRNSPEIVSLSYRGISIKISQTSPTNLYYAACNARERDCSGPYPQFMFSQSTFDDYHEWRCGNNSCMGYNRFVSVQCSGVIIATSTIDSSFYHLPNQYANHVLSSIASVSLLHPYNFLEVPLRGSVSLSLTLHTDLYLPQFYSCAIWDNHTLAWDTSVCSTHVTNPNSVTCQCQIPGTIAVVSTCLLGLYGPQCTRTCPHGLWGDKCSQSCVCSPQSTCLAPDGSCDCFPGYMGATCDTKCPLWSYGKNCLSACGCVRDRSIGCDHVNGSCDCNTGFRGDTCAITCNRGTWGYRCQQLCTCMPTGLCNYINGNCICDAGFTGVDCGTRCPAWRFASDCTGECTCERANTAYCRATDGLCVCNDTYTGVNCSIRILVAVDSVPIVPIAAGAGVSIVVVFLIVLLVIIILLCWRKKRRMRVVISPDKVPLYLRPESQPVSGARLSPEPLIRVDYNGFVSTKVDSYVAIPLRNSNSTLEEEDCWYFIEVVISGDRESWSPPSLREQPFQAPERPEIGVLSLSGRYSEDSKYESTFEKFPEPVWLPRADNTLFDLRSAFVESGQWSGGPFHFLKKDVAYTFIPLSTEDDYALSDLTDTNIYIQQVRDSDSCMIELCVCGKMSEFECSHCGTRGYCGEGCQTRNWEMHLPMCLKAQDASHDPSSSLNTTMAGSLEGSLLGDSVLQIERKLGVSRKLEQIGESEFEAAGTTTPIVHVRTHVRRESPPSEREELPLSKSDQEILEIHPDTDEVVLFDPHEDTRRHLQTEGVGSIPGSVPDQ